MSVLALLEALAVDGGLEAVLAAASLLVALLLEALLLRCPQRMVLLGLAAPAPGVNAGRRAPDGRIVGGQRGRGPPVSVVP